MLSHERLDVYQVAIAFVALARRIISKLPRGNADLADHLGRSSRATPLLVAEGAGKVTPAHKRRFFTDARGEALECGACLDVMQVEGIVEPEDYREGKELLEREVSMLTRMCR